MNTHRTRLAALAIAALLLAAYTAVLAWRVPAWGQLGWSGLAFHPYISKENEKEIGGVAKWFRIRSQTIILVAPASPAAKAGVKAGDRVLTIGGMPLKDGEKIASRTKGLRAGDQLTYRFERDGKPFERTLTLASPLRIPQMLWSVVVSILIGLAFLSISFSVFWARREDRAAFVFFLLCSVGAAFFLSMAAAEVESQSFSGVYPRQDISVVSIVIFALYFLLTVLLTSIILHFALVFPKDRPIVKQHPRVITLVHLLPFAVFVILLLSAVSMAGKEWWRPVVIGVPAVIALAASGFRLYALARHGRRAALIDHPFLVVAAALSLAVLMVQPVRAVSSNPFVAGILFVIVWVLLVCATFGGYALISCLSLYRSYRESGPEEKRQLRWPLWGFIVAVGGAGVIAVFYNLIAALNMDMIVGTPWVAVAVNTIIKLFYLLIPISFAFGILKYKLMEIDLVIKKTVVYTVVSGVVIGLYLLLVAGIGTLLVEYSGIRSQLVTIVSTLAIAALFIPLRNFVQRFVDRRFSRRRSDSADVLRRIGQQFALASDPDALLQQAAEMIQQSLQLRSVAILVRGRAGASHVAAKVGLPDAITARTLSFDPDAAPWNQALLVSEGEFTAPQTESLAAVRADAVAAVRTNGRNTAVVCAGRPLSDEGLNENDLHVLTAAADRLGAALETIRFKEEEAEFKQAQSIQQTLLPSTLPIISGFDLSAVWKPARTVGGDYYDAIGFDETTMALCIGDVVGKGMPAALLMSSLQATVRAVADRNTQPDEVCERVRRVITANLTGGRFITFFYGKIDAKERTFTFCNAGHNPPLLVRRDGSAERLSQGGAVLGRLFRMTQLERNSVRLSSGDRIVLYTDGVTEAVDEADDAFGEDRLERVIAASAATTAAQLQADILGALDEFSGGVVADDVALVVLVVQ